MALLAFGNLRIVQMILLLEASINIKGTAATSRTTTQTENSCAKVSLQASFRIGRMSQEKW